MSKRLASESSPYLLQHADNPVQWWPWCEEALALAREQNRPILLSIGYSTCHWCHVMARESFEDDEVAAQMNRDFINIKVDREERPDLDHIYQTAHQALTGRAGGWPLTMFLLPDGLPFFAGTYFPRRPQSRLPAFPDVLRELARAFETEREALSKDAARLQARLARASLPAPSEGVVLDAEPAEALQAALKQAFDRRYGGFGEAPKFPRVTDLEFLLYRAATRGDAEAANMALISLSGMAEGGLFDHVGGGFFRYSTDERWDIPHFEKMLYDNAALLRLYAQAWQASGEPRWRRVAEATAAWAMREMQVPAGAFCAALDAESDGREGRFYVWSREELKRCVPATDWRLFASRYGLRDRPNFEGEAWHLRAALPLERAARKAGLPAGEAVARLQAGRAALFAAREGRRRPGRDDKLLAGWNGLMIAGLAHAARVFGRADWLEAARRALDFVRTQLWREGRLLATSSGGPGRFNAYLDDHAFLIDAVLELAQADVAADELEFARALADALLEHFEDLEAGAFFFTRHDHEALILRPKPLHDNTMASGNGAAARALIRLGHLLGEPRYLAVAERAVRAAWPQLQRNPLGCAGLVLALQEVLEPPTLVLLSGQHPAALSGVLARSLRPDVMCVHVPPGRAVPAMLERPESGQAEAWVCRGSQCLPAVSKPAALAELLSGAAFPQ